MKTLLQTSMNDFNSSFRTMEIPTWVWVVYGLVVILLIASMWKIFTKAGKPGWACIVPFYNLYVMVQIAKKPTNWFWILLGLIVGCLIPFLGIVCMIAYIVLLVMIVHGLSTSFGQGAGFTVGLLLLGIVFYPLLAFGNYTYIQDDLKPSSPDLMDA